MPYILKQELLDESDLIPGCQMLISSYADFRHSNIVPIFTWTKNLTIIRKFQFYKLHR